MFTPEQVKALSAKLDGAHVKERAQAGRKLSYIEGWHAIAEANRIFGFDSWDRETIECRLVTERECKVGKGQYEKDGWRVAYVARVRVTVWTRAAESKIVRDGTGYGSGIDADLGSAHESAIKEAETDAMKRALMTFGNPFGLALYDKEQAEVERNGNGHGAATPPAEHPEKAQAREMYAGIAAAIAAATHPGDTALGLKVDRKDREDIAFIRKHGGDAAADKLQTLAATKIAELSRRNAA